MSPTSKPINTAKVHKRRSLSFTSLDDVLVELDHLEGKKLEVLGNWTVGQILKHLAIPMDGAIDGLHFKMPLYMRIGAKIFKPFVLKMKMPAGFRLPSLAASIMVPDSTISDSEGFAALRHAIGRLKTNSHRTPHPVMGSLTIEQWNQIMCRHCELHLSFIQPVD